LAKTANQIQEKKTLVFGLPIRYDEISMNLQNCPVCLRLGCLYQKTFNSFTLRTQGKQDTLRNETNYNDIQHNNKLNATLSITTLSVMAALPC
jgi:hypothetical protein